MQPGTPYGGGVFVARYFIGDQAFALIASPKDRGDIASTKWGATKKRVAGALSYADGLANTDAMATAGSKLAKGIRALRIGDHDDWYLPSRLESLLLFGELPGEFERDWYWTSTQYAGHAGYAWFQGFYHGYQDDTREDGECRARAVRRIPI